MIKVKICGITNEEDAKHSVLYGADALGFIFYPESSRYVDIETVKNICYKLPPFINTVGVFVNEDHEKINSITDYCHLTSVQLHGDENPRHCKKINRTVIKALHVKNRLAEETIKKFNTTGAILLDTYDKDTFGGTGKTFDWKIASSLIEKNCIILSGGLNCTNILSALRCVHPYAVDVCSGVEETKGKKDPFLLKKFIHLVKSSNW